MVEKTVETCKQSVLQVQTMPSRVRVCVLEEGARRGARLTREEESVVHVARRVALRLEKRVEIPKGGLHKAVRRHLRETAQCLKGRGEET